MRYCILGVMYLFIFILGAGLMPQENPAILLDEPLPPRRTVEQPAEKGQSASQVRDRVFSGKT